MTTIAWYQTDNPYNAPAVDSYQSFVPAVDATGVIDSMYIAGIEAGFVGEPTSVGKVTFEPSWEAVDDSPSPVAMLTSYDKLEWSDDAMDFVATSTHPYINIACEARFGIYRLRVRIDGVLAAGQLTLTLADAGSGYANVGWDWGPGGGDVGGGGDIEGGCNGGVCLCVVVNPRDLLMQAAPSRLHPVFIQPNVIIPELLPSLEVPPTPTGFAVSAAISNVIIQHDAPLFSGGHGYARTHVYGALWYGGARPVFADAVRITSFTGMISSYATSPAQVWHLWATWESRDGVESLPAGGENGLVAKTGQDVERLVAAMTGPGNPFTILEEPTEIDGVLYPAGTYTTLALIFEAQVARAQIALLAVDDARIASVAVSKLTAGAIAVSEYIRSFDFVPGVQGFEIHGSGWAEFNDVLIRGELNTGNFAAYAWPAAGGTGAHLSASGLMIGNANDGTYFQVTAEGNVYAPGLSIVGGVANFAGALTGASLNGGSINGTTGTFDGQLTARAINAVKTINIAGNAVTTSVNGVGGSLAQAVIYVPPDEYMNITIIGSCSNSSLLELLIDGVVVGTATPTVNAKYFDIGDSGLYEYSINDGIAMGLEKVYGGAQGRTVLVSATGSNFYAAGQTPITKFTAFGALR